LSFILCYSPTKQGFFVFRFSFLGFCVPRVLQLDNTRRSLLIVRDRKEQGRLGQLPCQEEGLEEAAFQEP